MGTVGIDLMGGETSPEVMLPAIKELAKELREEAHLVLIGTIEILDKAPTAPNITHIAAEEVIEMEDDPLLSLRRKKNSSLCIGMKLLKAGELDALVSLGNTGALMASARLFLKMIKGIDRPALLTLLPTEPGEVAVLDVGANVTVKPSHLIQFAKMGIAYQKSRGIKKPQVGLLNIGTEEKKGTALLRETHIKLQKLPGFVGNIEGRDVFSSNIDVLVTDGFTGNIFLKTAEGIAGVILHQIEQMRSEGASERLKDFLDNLAGRLSYAEFPGAILCGVQKIVVKCHGNASPSSLCISVKGALRLSKHNFVDSLSK